MAGPLTAKTPKSLNTLKRLGDQRMADAHQAVEDSQRLAHDTAEIVAETIRLHDRLHAGGDRIRTRIPAQTPRM